MSTLSSYYLLGRAALSTARICLPTIVDDVLKRVDARVCDARLDSWSRSVLRTARIELDVRGLEHFDRSQAYIVVSNHQSYYDIPVVFQALQAPLRMAAKAELFKVPIWGEAMRASGFIAVDRKKGSEALRAVLAARERMIADHTSLWLAPEGTRSPDGRLLPFKVGAFQLALAAKLPLLPLTIDGAIDVHRTGSNEIHYGKKVTVTVSPAVDAQAYGRKRLRELMTDVRAAIAGPLGERAGNAPVIADDESR